MDILRRDWTTLEQVAVNLVARGIAFNTFRRAPPPIFPLIQPPVQPYRGLGYRPQDFRTDAGEYAGYEAIRNRIFCSGRGRAALMMGGIIARLARDVVALQSVYRGPTKTVSVDGQCVWDGHPSAPAYWDDALTAEELEIICGVYEVATGVSDPNREGGQTRCGSWWPLPAAWSLSGLDMGHWTPSCETWFQRRLAQNRGGDGLLQTHTQWKHNLAFERKGAPLSHNNERLAEEFLAENGTRIARDPQAQQFPRAIRSQGPGSETPSDGFYFALRTQEPKSAASDSADIEPVISSSLPDVQLPPQVKQPLKPEVQQATRQYWDTRRKISSALLRGRVIEQRLRALHVKNPQDIYLNSSELAERFRRVETELAEERRRTREVEKTVGDIQRECKTPTVVPTLLWVATIEE
ncbi:hypothetical protein DFH09DRAFT_1022563 [Mycena vulgaris]|nr:hypothetical protein DFH09DRAFT_1022563 [Mycena vulgaris]